MATVVVYTRDETGYRFFIGKESNFLHDGHPEVRSLETHTFPPNTSVIEMRKHFRMVAHELSETFGFRVQFDTPKQDPETHIAKVRFRRLKKSAKFGIVKGGAEAVDEGDTRKTALREFREECMNANVPLDAFEKSSSTSQPRDLYYLDVTDLKEKLEQVMEAWRITYYGELYETQLMTKKEVCSNWNSLNQITQKAFLAFFEDMGVSCKKGGSGRKTQSSKVMVRRGRRRTRSSR